MTRTVFDTAQVAHVWAQGRQEEGRNAARRVYFEGAKLFSYGSHFLTGYRLPDGSAFLNSGRYSVSTARHQSQARYAIPGRVSDVTGQPMRLYVPAPLMNETGRYRSGGNPLPDFMEEEIFARPVWRDRAGQEVPGPYDATGERVGFKVYGETRPATPAQAKAARPALLNLFLNCEETAPAETIQAAFRYAGAKPEEAAKAAAKVAAAHAKRAKEEAAKRAKDKADGAARDAKAAAARPLSDFAATVQEARADLKRHNRRGDCERARDRLLENATALFRAAKEAKARGWTRVAADLKAREKVLRQGAAGLESYAVTLARLSYWGEKKGEIRAGLAALRGEGPALVGGYAWQVKRQAAESLLKDCRAAALAPVDDSEGAFPADLARAARLMGASLPAMAAGLESIVAALQGAESRAYAGQARATIRAEVASLRAWKEAGPGADLKTAEEAAKVAGRYALVTYYAGAVHRPQVPAAYRLAGFTGEAFAAIKEAAKARAVALKLEESAAKIEAWRAGEGPLPGRLSDPSGGALLRAVGVKRDDSGAITGGRLGTSWGAEVPLVQAVAAFRFLKLCRDNARAWRANGRTLQVGHFRIDSVDTSGNFRAGCHSINWPEVAALAARLGLSDLAPADTTKESAHG